MCTHAVSSVHINMPTISIVYCELLACMCSVGKDGERVRHVKRSSSQTVRDQCNLLQKTFIKHFNQYELINRALN